MLSFSHCHSRRLVSVMATKEKAVSSASGARPASGSKRSGLSMIPVELFQLGTYKQSQGKTVRLVTALTFGIIVALSSWQLYETLATSNEGLKWVVPGVLLFAGWWLSWRAVQVPRFADFLIAVEAEMTKVSWPTQTELFRASAVVIFFIISLAALLFVFDLFWRTLFQFLGVIGGG